MSWPRIIAIVAAVLGSLPWFARYGWTVMGALFDLIQLHEYASKARGMADNMPAPLFTWYEIAVLFVGPPALAFLVWDVFGRPGSRWMAGETIRADAPPAAEIVSEAGPNMTIGQTWRYIQERSKWGQDKYQIDAQNEVVRAVKDFDLQCWGRLCTNWPNPETNLTFSDTETPIPDELWKHMYLWMGSALSEYPSRWGWHLTLPVNPEPPEFRCYGMIRVNAGQVMKLWPPLFPNEVKASQVPRPVPRRYSKAKVEELRRATKDLRDVCYGVQISNAPERLRAFEGIAEDFEHDPEFQPFLSRIEIGAERLWLMAKAPADGPNAIDPKVQHELLRTTTSAIDDLLLRTSSWVIHES